MRESTPPPATTPAATEACDCRREQLDQFRRQADADAAQAIALAREELSDLERAMDEGQEVGEKPDDLFDRFWLSGCEASIEIPAARCQLAVIYENDAPDDKPVAECQPSRAEIFYQHEEITVAIPARTMEIHALLVAVEEFIRSRLD